MPKVENLDEKYKGMVDDSECCICFSYESEDDVLPDEVCNNIKCHRRFHAVCLYEVRRFVL